MSKLLLVAFSLLSAPAFADWVCEAYCPIGNWTKQLYQHGNHPVDILNALAQECLAANGGHDGNYIFVSGGSQATVANACKQIDTTCK
jgi:hypothetical protein